MKLFGTVYSLSFRHVKLKQQLLSVECHLLSHITNKPEFTGKTDCPHAAIVSLHALRYGSSRVLQSVHDRFGQTDTTQLSIFTVSQGNQIILLIYGTVLPGGAKTIISHLFTSGCQIWSLFTTDCIHIGIVAFAVEYLSSKMKSHS